MLRTDEEFLEELNSFLTRSGFRTICPDFQTHLAAWLQDHAPKAVDQDLQKAYQKLSEFTAHSAQVHLETEGYPDHERLYQRLASRGTVLLAYQVMIHRLIKLGAVNPALLDRDAIRQRQEDVKQGYAMLPARRLWISRSPDPESSTNGE